MSAVPVNLSICVTCQNTPAEGERLGAQLYRALETMLGQRSDIRLKPVECMAVCKRACTIVVSAPGKWTYVIGDLDPTQHMDELFTYLDAYANDPNGTPSLKSRPAAIRSGTIARIPPTS